MVDRERGIGTGETRSGVEPKPNAEDKAQRPGPGKTPGKAEG
jgi:hypothetical protein